MKRKNIHYYLFDFLTILLKGYLSERRREEILVNIIMGFIVPWIFGFILYKKKPIIVLLIAPIGMTVAFILNEWGTNYFWQFEPTFRNRSLSALPLNIGFYPVLSSFLIYFKLKKKGNTIMLLFCFTLFTTGFEGMGLAVGRVEYFNEWNIIGTFISYLIAYFIIYGYYQILLKYQILKN
ncbi:hypothetical protein COM86_27270 [Priestia megaterium]|nr:hypothetical protein COM86_27270 [Priestia megaterium]PEE73397.1 hypothetical protein COM81_28930 [Priestia megaterium]PFI95725.1 hypothetical protein COI84_14825 [Priestia megaterium]PGR16574.1 hypothetical protein COC62_00370 [Priestia megaterium]